MAAKTHSIVRWGVGAFLALVAISAIVMCATPSVQVETSLVDRGPVALEIVDEGLARVQDAYEISAPVDGQLQRITLEPGDRVRAGDIIARIAPSASALLDARSRQDAQAAVAAARAQWAEARAQSALADEEHRRTRTLHDRGIASPAALDRAAASAEAARRGVDARRAELARAQALLSPGNAGGGGQTIVRAPVSGVVLDVIQESAGVVRSGARLMSIGDPNKIEIAGEFLSQEAVRVPENAPAQIENWGGTPLRATVFRIEPLARQEISALGVEEQRTRVILRLKDHAGATRLGHGYRVDVRITLTQSEEALRAPADALVRGADGWAVFRVVNGRAVRTPVEVGEASGEYRPILKGLDEGDRLVRYPSSRMADGASVTTSAK
jgi:HlyD family secretion protein